MRLQRLKFFESPRYYKNKSVTEQYAHQYVFGYKKVKKWV